MELREPDFVDDALAEDIIDAAMIVHRTLGPGFLESVYEEALCLEFVRQEISFVRQKPISVNYFGQKVGEGKIDLVVGDSVIVELKAVESLLPIHKAQVISYLKMSGCCLGLLINFNVPLLKDGLKRIVLTKR